MHALLASIPSPSTSAIELGPLRFTFDGMIIAVGVALAWRMTVRRYAAAGGEPELAERVLLRVVIFGFLGARTAYVLPRLSRFADDPLSVFAIWEGGLALYGGITAGAITAVVLMRRWGGDLPALLDGLAPAVPLAQAIGRWGNYFNQELFGTPTDLPWGLEIAPENRPAAYPDAETFHPTFLYESIWNLGLSAFIIWLGKRYPSLRGRLIAVYLAGYALIRFMLELIRTDTTFRFLGLSRNAWVSIAVMLIAVAIALRGRAKDPSAGAPSA
jgi:prolipoprotein diacylglyceryl transferase